MTESKRPKWIPVKQTKLYDPSANSKDAEVTILSSELNELKKFKALAEELAEALEQIDNHTNCKVSFEVCKNALAKYWVAVIGK